MFRIRLCRSGLSQPADSGHQRRPDWPLGRPNRAADASKSTGGEFAAEQAGLVGEARQPQGAGPLGREADSVVVGGIAREQHGVNWSFFACSSGVKYRSL